MITFISEWSECINEKGNVQNTEYKKCIRNILSVNDCLKYLELFWDQL